MTQEEITVKFKVNYIRLWPLKAFIYWVSLDGDSKSFSLVFIWKGEVKFVKVF